MVDAHSKPLLVEVFVRYVMSVGLTFDVLVDRTKWGIVGKLYGPTAMPMID